MSYQVNRATGELVCISCGRPFESRDTLALHECAGEEGGDMLYMSDELASAAQACCRAEEQVRREWEWRQSACRTWQRARLERHAASRRFLRLEKGLPVTYHNLNDVPDKLVQRLTMQPVCFYCAGNLYRDSQGHASCHLDADENFVCESCA